MQLILELQPNQLIAMTRLDTNLTPKNRPFTSRLILLFLTWSGLWLFIFDSWTNCSSPFEVTLRRLLRWCHLSRMVDYFPLQSVCCALALPGCLACAGPVAWAPFRRRYLGVSAGFQGPLSRCSARGRAIWRGGERCYDGHLLSALA
jgi:hypothetical protein